MSKNFLHSLELDLQKIGCHLEKEDELSFGFS